MSGNSFKDLVQRGNDDVCETCKVQYTQKDYHYLISSNSTQTDQNTTVTLQNNKSDSNVTSSPQKVDSPTNSTSQASLSKDNTNQTDNATIAATSVQQNITIEGNGESKPENETLRQPINFSTKDTNELIRPRNPSSSKYWIPDVERQRSQISRSLKLSQLLESKYADY
ncbi:UNKNOWN [Stylonychia lemnae]|uniref:Uncharacterized protein n=1 Tax=Stylonychia lemnae TaxID=5949 RepID=A0A078B785_STYLE|nr:UNKNOWN [Stylonychia lemnae]|eukprot:CDW89413.1 UNKNOWN [Stylonychia lemnae]